MFSQKDYNREESLLPHYKGFSKRHGTWWRIYRAYSPVSNSLQMEGGFGSSDKEETPEALLKSSDWIISAYQTVGVFYFVANCIILGRFSAFSAMIAALTFSSVTNEAFYFNRLVLGEVNNIPFLVGGVINLILGITAFVVTFKTEDSSAVDYGCSIITMAYCILNIWRALLTDDLQNMDEPHPWTFLVQGAV